MKVSYILLIMMITASSCYKDLIPKEKDYFSNNVSYGRDAYQVNTGRTNIFMGDFNSDYSSQPLTFTIQNPKHSDSTAAPELLQQVATWQWQKYYSGYETNIADIYQKRVKENRPILDIRPNSGDIIFWNVDTTIVKPGIYTFDILVKNGGGQKLFTKRTLDVRRPRPYDPYEYWDDTYIQKSEADGGIIHPDISGVQDELNNDYKRENINIYVRRTDIKSNTLTFKFFDKDSLPIPVSRFNTEQWDSLKYYSKTIDVNVPFAFNRTIPSDSSSVTWDITSPFPVLADVGNSDEKADITFNWTRVSFGTRRNASIHLRFAIYEPGNWDIIYKFKVNPHFTND
jgi:hypothetical protein